MYVCPNYRKSRAQLKCLCLVLTRSSATKLRSLLKKNKFVNIFIKSPFSQIWIFDWSNMAPSRRLYTEIAMELKLFSWKKKKNLCERRHLELKRIIKKYKGCCTHDTDIHLQSLRIELFIIFQASSAKSRIKNKWSWIKIEQDTITLFVRRIELIAVKKNINYKAHFYWFPRAVRKIYIYTFATPHKD